MISLKPGTRLRSTVCPTEVIVVAAPPQPVSLACGGHPMTQIEPGSSANRSTEVTVNPALASGTVLGKRYASDGSVRLEVLCTKAGEGTLTLDGDPLHLKSSNALPSSD